jgi:Holliday junction resolvasome RuvABC ATP-dependent DNA helicase subunit
MEHIYQIFKQRVNLLNWRASETTLRLIAQNAKNNPGTAIKMLQQCYILSRVENRDKINITHAKKALVLSS